MPLAPLATSFGDTDLEFLVGVVLFGGEVEVPYSLSEELDLPRLSG